MSKTYVTLVSEQAIPNVQYIKEFAGDIGTYLFISTNWMEETKRTQQIIDACQITEGSYEMIIVDEEDLMSLLESIKLALTKETFANTEGYIVNCTLGTKIMSIALYEYFKNNDKAMLLYTPIRTNKYRSVLDNSINKEFSTHISVDEYIKSYGIAIKSKGTPLFSNEAYTNSFKERYLNFGEQEFAILAHLQNDDNQKYRNKGIKDFALIEGLNDFLINIEFPFQNTTKLSKYEVKYLTGGWFEEWTYYAIKNKLQLKDDEIVLGLNTVIDAENDLDIVFMFKNDIHIVECKTAIPDSSLQQTTLYKSGALVDKFGRNAHSYLFTLSNLSDNEGNLKTAIKDRAAQQKINVQDRFSLLNNIDNFFAKFSQ
jgi:hypothetical protein